MISNKLKIFDKNYYLLDEIIGLFNNKFDETELFDYLMEMYIDISSTNGFRLLSDNIIKTLALDHEYSTKIILFLSELFNIINNLFPHDFNCNIISNMHIVDDSGYLKKYQ